MKIARGCRVRCCGCLFLLALLIVALVALLIVLARQADAAAPGAATHHYVILADQSRSVVESPEIQSLTHQVIVSAVNQLRSSAGKDDTVRLIFFGARVSTVISITPLLDQSLEARLQAALGNPHSLGGTQIVEALAGLLEDNEPMTDVLLITDGVPDAPGTQTPSGRAAYASQLVELAARFAQRGVTLSALLVGPSNRDDWMPAWKDTVSAARGVLVEIPSIDSVQPAMQALATPLPTAAPPTPTKRTATATPTLRPSPAATSPSITRVSPSAPTSMASAKPTRAAFPWLPLVAGVGFLAGVGGLVAVRRARKSKRMPKKASPIGDQGLLEIFDPQTDDVQRIELHDMSLGEVWGLGNRPDCKIRLGRAAGEDELAALVLTPDGPLIQSRGAPMWFENQQVKQHLLFDGDDIYLGQFVIGYQNFFRRRKVEGEDEPEGEEERGA